MSFVRFTRLRIVFSLLLALLFIFPMNATYASQNNNQMISDECLQNPDACEDSGPSADENSAEVGLDLWDYLKMLFSLIFVILIMVYVLKFINKKSVNYQHNNLVRNVGGVSVGSQKSVQLLHIGDALYIVGVGENVQLIKEINEPEEVEKLLEYYNEKQSMLPTTPHFVNLLKKVKSVNKDDSKTSNDEDNFGDLFNKKISDIKRERKHELQKWKEKERDK